MELLCTSISSTAGMICCGAWACFIAQRRSLGLLEGCWQPDWRPLSIMDTITGLGSSLVSEKFAAGGISTGPLTPVLVEGIMTTIFGIICFFFMPHTPADAKFLTEEERAAAMFRLRQDAHGATDIADVNEEKFDWRWVRMALKAPQTWLSSLIWFFVLIPLYVSLALRNLWQCIGGCND